VICAAGCCLLVNSVDTPVIDEIRFCRLYFSNSGYLVYCLFSGDILVENRNGQYFHRETGGKS